MARMGYSPGLRPPAQFDVVRAEYLIDHLLAHRSGLSQ